MSDNTFDPEEINLQVQPLPAFIDGDGAFKLNTPMLSSMNFDGLIPKYDGFISASQVQAGYLIDINLNNEFYQVLSVEYDDLDLEVTNSVTINYINDQGYITSAVYNATSSVYVNYEDWNNKILGTQGWGITNAGNAIFSNVAVRGRVEATEGAIEGDLTLGGSLTASTNLGFVQISASGILGVTASGRFHLDNLDGEITLTGNIHARGGSLEYLTIGDNYFPIHNIIGQPAYSTENVYNGAIILTIYQYKYDPNIPMFTLSGFQYPSLTTTEVKRYMAKGDYFKLSGVSASGAAINNNNGQPYSQSQTNSILNDTWRVESASAGFVETSASLVVDRYFCVRYTPYTSSNPTYNFQNVSASSGSFTNGFLFSGEYNVKNGSAITRVDGLTFSSINAGTTWNDYIPDFIDLSGRLRLANGYIRNTINTASGTTTGVYVRGSLQNMRPVQTVSASFFRPSTGVSKGASQKIDSESVITNYIYEINPITASCVFSIAESGLVNGDYFDVVNIGTGSIIFKTNSASIDAYLDKKVLLGKWASATVRKRSSNSVLLSGDLS